MDIKKIKNVVDDIYSQYADLKEGELANYIPELAKVNPNLFAISVITVDGNIYQVGDFETEFTLQSTSKPIVYSLALQQRGEELVHSKVGVEPTGEAFNSIIELEEKSHRPFNPMINSGAIETTSLILGDNFESKLHSIISIFKKFTDKKDIKIDNAVFESEKKTAHRNRAIAYLMKHFNVMDTEIEETLDLYFKQCSILYSAKDLAQLAATYANQGIHPFSNQKILSEDHATKTLSLMFTCGMYDTAGEWAFKVGLPAKSGVSGALFAVVPGQMGIAVYSPRIDQHGHSVKGRKVIEAFSKKLNINIFNSKAKL